MDDERGFVYFAFAGEFIKIGWSKDPHARADHLQTGSPLPITIPFAIRGDRTDEKHLHEVFAHLRVQGEWFRNDGLLGNHIAWLYERDQR